MDPESAARPYRGVPQDFESRPLFDLLRSAAALDPDALALVDGRDRISYRDLLRHVRLAARALGDGGGPVAVLMPNTPAGLAAVLGCLVARRIVLLLDAQQPAERNALILSDAGATALVCAADAPALPVAGLPRIAIASLFAGTDDPAWEPPAAFGPHDPAIVFFTSGSTGRPKGIVRPLWSLLYRSRVAIDGIHLGPADRMLNASQTTTDASVARYLAILCTGGRIVLYQPNIDGLAALRERLIAEAVTFLVAGPALMRVALSLPGMQDAFATLRDWTCGGAAVLRADLDAARGIMPAACVFRTTYASTEAGVVASWAIPRDLDGHGPRVPSGWLRAGMEVALLDASQGVGELVVRGPGVALGEWQEGRCVPGRMPADPEHAGWRVFRTGDLVRIGDDGLLHFVSRVDQQIKVKGVRIEPAEIEAVLRRVAGVTDAVVMARTVAEHAGSEETVLVAHVAAAGDRAAVLEALREHLRLALPSVMRPSQIEVHDRLPRMAGGKVDLRALAQHAQAGLVRRTLSAILPRRGR